MMNINQKNPFVDKQNPDKKPSNLNKNNNTDNNDDKKFIFKNDSIFKDFNTNKFPSKEFDKNNESKKDFFSNNMFSGANMFGKDSQNKGILFDNKINSDQNNMFVKKDEKNLTQKPTLIQEIKNEEKKEDKFSSTKPLVTNFLNKQNNDMFSKNNEKEKSIFGNKGQNTLFSMDKSSKNLIFKPVNFSNDTTKQNQEKTLKKEIQEQNLVFKNELNSTEKNIQKLENKNLKNEEKPLQQFTPKMTDNITFRKNNEIKFNFSQQDNKKTFLTNNEEKKDEKIDDKKDDKQDSKLDEKIDVKKEVTINTQKIDKIEVKISKIKKDLQKEKLPKLITESSKNIINFYEQKIIPQQNQLQQRVQQFNKNNEIIQQEVQEIRKFKSNIDNIKNNLLSQQNIIEQIKSMQNFIENQIDELEKLIKQKLPYEKQQVEQTQNFLIKDQLQNIFKHLFTSEKELDELQQEIQKQFKNHSKYSENTIMNYYSKIIDLQKKLIDIDEMRINLKAYQLIIFIEQKKIIFIGKFNFSQLINVSSISIRTFQQQKTLNDDDR